MTKNITPRNKSDKIIAVYIYSLINRLTGTLLSETETQNYCLYPLKVITHKPL